MTTTLLRSPHQPPPAGRRTRWWLVTAVAAALLLGAAVAVVGFTPLFGVRSVQVSGARAVPQQQVLQAAAIAEGIPLVRLDKAAIRRRVQAIPAVRSVEVTTSLPSTVRITITERVPLGYRPVEDYFEITDSAGVEFRAQRSQPRTVPRIDATHGSPAAKAAVEVAASLPPDLLARTSAVSAPTADEVSIALSDGRVVFWGSTDRDDDKAHLLKALLSRPGGYFDLSDPDAVISRPAA